MSAQEIIEGLQEAVAYARAVRSWPELSEGQWADIEVATEQYQNLPGEMISGEGWD